MRFLLICSVFFTSLVSIPATGQTPSGDALLVGADGRIDRYRKSDATVVVVDRSGEPIPDVHVKIEQVRHAFLFGCAAISLLKHTDAGQEEVYQKRFGD